MSRYQKKHSPTHHPDHHPIFISFFHLLQSITSFLFKLRAWQSLCTLSVRILFCLPLGLEPSTSYSIHLFTQSVSSFCFHQKKQKSKEVSSVVGIVLLHSSVSARFQHATDAVYDQYRCPVFKGFVVCVSGLASEDRNSVRSLVELNG